MEAQGSGVVCWILGTVAMVGGGSTFGAEELRRTHSVSCRCAAWLATPETPMCSEALHPTYHVHPARRIATTSGGRQKPDQMLASPELLGTQLKVTEALGPGLR